MCWKNYRTRRSTSVVVFKSLNMLQLLGMRGKRWEKSTEKREDGKRQAICVKWLRKDLKLVSFFLTTEIQTLIYKWQAGKVSMQGQKKKNLNAQLKLRQRHSHVQLNKVTSMLYHLASLVQTSLHEKPSSPKLSTSSSEIAFSIYS